MTTEITKESLAENIGRLESYGDLSLNEEYQLKAYRLLLERFKIDDECHHDWIITRKHAPEVGYVHKVVCNKCGRSK
ncbi:hypothetical protein ACDF60_004528 [Salmonella enterica]